MEGLPLKLLLPFVMACLPTLASATGVVLALDSSRCYTGAYQYYLTGNGMVGPHAALVQDNWTVQETALVTTTSLQGVDIFVAGQLIPGTTLSPGEASDLQSGVAGGGSVLYMGEGDGNMASNVQFGALFNGPQYGGQYFAFGVTDVIVAPTHPLIQGPAGTVNLLTGFNVPGFWTNVPPSATTIATNPDSSAAVVVLPYGAGKVVLMNDSAYFSVPPTYSADHNIFWRNTIAWLAATGSPVTVFCSGDGSATACPCGNFGAPGAGCANSLGLGSTLGSAGTASIANDTFVLNASGMPNSAGLYLQGTLRLNGGMGFVFGDGLRCSGGAVVRLGTETSAGGVSSYPGPGDTPISIRGSCTAGATRNYQTWYRNVANFCTPASFNLTNGVEVTWSP